MTSRKQTIKHIIQVNQHLKEWNANLALETKTSYRLASKHTYERSCLFLNEVSPSERTQLATQQLQEIYQLKIHYSQIRLALEDRQSQEKAHLNQQLD